MTGRPELRLGRLRSAAESKSDRDNVRRIRFPCRTLECSATTERAPSASNCQAPALAHPQGAAVAAVVQHAEASSVSGRLSFSTTKTSHSLPSGSWTQVLSCVA